MSCLQQIERFFAGHRQQLKRDRSHSHPWLVQAKPPCLREDLKQDYE